jgi:hypothetical protein
MLPMQTEPIPTPFNSQGPSAAGTAGAAAGEVSRRALFVTAGLGVCAAGAVATPIALKYAEEQAAAALQRGINQGVQEGIDEGKNLALAGLDTLESISLQAAIDVAEASKLGVQYLLLPLSSFVAAVGGDAIGALVGAVDGVRGFAGNFGYHNDTLDKFSATLHSWQTNLQLAPKLLASYSTMDITTTEAYLKSLQAQVEAAKAKVGQSGATPTATP